MDELTDEQVKQLQEAKQLLPRLKEQIRRAKSAGIDVTAQEADVAALEKQLDSLYRVYVRKASTTTG